VFGTGFGFEPAGADCFEASDLAVHVAAERLGVGAVEDESDGGFLHDSSMPPASVAWS
jgi:hypothetical protein